MRASAFADGMKILRDGGRALDAVEATIRVVESNPNDHTVGYSGLPEYSGRGRARTQGIMDGRTLETGAVCAVHNYEHVISVAPRRDGATCRTFCSPALGRRDSLGRWVLNRGKLLTPEAKGHIRGSRLPRERTIHHAA